MDYRTALAIEVRDLAKHCGIRRKDVAYRLGLQSMRNLNYWCKGVKDGKPFFPSLEHIGLLERAKEHLKIIDRHMNWFGGRKAYLERGL